METNNLGNNLGAIAKAISSIILKTQGVRKLLGFSLDKYSSLKVSNHKFIAETQLMDTLLPQSINVYVSNLSLDSYNNTTGGRVNLIRTIPNLIYTSNDNRFSFQTSYPIFIDLKNTNILNLTNLRLRMTDFNGEKVQMRRNDTHITLLLE
jgi:hypothetical protein